MTEPAIPPVYSEAAYGPYLGIPAPMWCRRCETHWATTAQPLCPGCLDDRAREIGGGK